MASRLPLVDVAGVKKELPSGDTIPVAGLDVTGLDGYYPRIDGSNAGPGGFRNYIIDGRFDRWDEGTSITASGYGAATMWRLTLGSGAAGTFSQQAFTLGQTDVPGLPVYSAQFNRTTTGSTATVIRQRMENVRTLEGRPVRWAFYAKVSSGTAALTVNVIQNFGTGGSPSSNVNTSAGGGTVTTSWTLISDTLTIPSISGKTIGSDGNDYLDFSINFPTAAGNVSLDIAMVALYEGQAERLFSWPGRALEDMRVSRYFERISGWNRTVGRAGSTTQGQFRRDVAPKRGTATATASASGTWGTILGAGAVSAVGATEIYAGSVYVALTTSGATLGQAISVAAGSTGYVDVDARL